LIPGNEFFEFRESRAVTNNTCHSMHCYRSHISRHSIATSLATATVAQKLQQMKGNWPRHGNVAAAVGIHG